MALTALVGTSVLQQVDPLIWTMLAMSIAGAVVTYLILALALWKFRDPETKGRRYG